MSTQKAEKDGRKTMRVYMLVWRVVCGVGMDLSRKLNEG
jgi:hypothetical protein